MSLSGTTLRKLNGKIDQQCELKDRDGLSASVSPKGKISFQQRFQWLGKLVRMKLGTYPELTLVDARAIENKGLIEKGVDPRIFKKSIIAKKQTGPITVRLGLEYWLEEYAANNHSDTNKLTRMFEMYVYPSIGDVVIDTFEKCHWLIVFKTTEKHPQQVGRLLKILKQALRFLFEYDKVNCFLSV